MSNQRISKNIIACGVLALASMSSSVSYASACKVQYKIHGGSTKTVELKVNQTKYVNKKVDYVKNVGVYGLDVSFTVQGAFNENFTMGTKSPHNRNPGSGNYAHYASEHKLKKFKCQKGKSFTNIAKGMVAVGNSPAVIVKLARDGFNMTEREIAKVLKQIGITAEDAAKTLHNYFKPTFSQLGTWMKYAGYAVEQVASALEEIGAKANHIAYMFKHDFDKRAEIAYRDLSRRYNATSSQIATWMKYAGYTINEIARALRTSAKLSAEAAMKVLMTVHKVSKEKAIAALRSAGYTAQQLADLIEKPNSRIITKSPSPLQIQLQKNVNK